MMLTVLVLSLMSGVRSEECPTCDNWLGGDAILCAYNAVTYQSKCDLFVALCLNGVISTGGNVDINTIGVESHVRDYIDYMGKCNGDDTSDNCPKCDNAASNPICGRIGSSDVDFASYCHLAKHLCETRVIAFDENTDFDLLDEEYYSKQGDVQDHTNWKGKCTGLCPRGEYSIFNNKEYPCQMCPQGQSSDIEGANKCQKCAKGKYQSLPGQASCMPCPPNTMTKEEGSTNITQCLEPCDWGKFSLDGYEGDVPCEECPKGTYQDEYGQTVCKSCPAGSTTVQTGSIHAIQCVIPCSPGQFSIDGFEGVSQCQDCPIGTHQSSRGQTSCNTCPTGTTTLQTGSTNSSQCLAKCKPGSWSLDGYDADGCQDCFKGTFQSLEGQTSCRSCPPDTITRHTGSTDLNDCVAKCLEGTFSADSYAPCTQCNGNSYSDNTGSISCVKCEVGVVNKNKTKCVPCLQGSYFTGLRCSPCSPGSYSDTQGALNCTLCKPGYFGPDNAAVMCEACQEGTYQAHSGSIDCQVCPKDTYVDHTAATSCIECPNGGKTGGDGVKSKEQCGAYNWAIIGHATQSGTTWNGTADKAIDGRVKRSCHRVFCTHTEFMKNPWWSVDLREERNIVEIAIIVPNDTLSGVEGARVTVGNNNNATDTECGVLSFKELIANRIHFVCKNGTKGRYVRVAVTIPQSTYLALCEVEAYSVSPKVPCPLGSVSDTGHRPCKPCPVGFITKKLGSKTTECLSCPHGWTTYRDDLGKCDGPKIFVCEDTKFNGQCKVYKGLEPDLDGLDRKISSINVVEGDWFVYTGKKYTRRVRRLEQGWIEEDLYTVLWEWSSMNDEIRSIRPAYSQSFCYMGYGEKYHGKHQTTKSGKQCQKWSEQWPHRHNYKESMERGIGDHAYCRNPDQSNMGPWCYTTELDVVKEACNVPRCASKCPKGHYVNLNVCTLCPSSTYSTGGDTLTCNKCPSGKTSFIGSDNINDCFTPYPCDWGSKYLCDQISGCSYGCHKSWCWSQCNGACITSSGVDGVCEGCHEWCYLDTGRGYYKSCDTHDDCTAIRRNGCYSLCTV